MIRAPKLATFVVPLEKQASVAVRAAPVRPNNLFQVSKFDTTPINPPLPGTPPKEGTGPANSNPHLTYYGGRVLDHAVLSNIYYGDFWNTAQGKSEKQWNDNFTQDIGHSSLSTVWAQYGVGQATFDRSTVLSAKAPSTIMDSDIQKIIAQQIDAGAVVANDEGLYTFMCPPNTVVDSGIKAKDGHEITSAGDFGGYHGFFMHNGKPVMYSVIPYQGKDSATYVGSHEISEALTDPLMTWDIPSSRPAWYDSDALPGSAPGASQWGEIGDIANFQGTDQATTVDGFSMQPIWSNVDNQAEVGAVNPGPVQALPTPSTDVPLIIN